MQTPWRFKRLADVLAGVLAGALAVAFGALTACAPALDWREVRPPGQAVFALFPCKPEFNARPAEGSASSAMGLAQCEAKDLRFSLAWAEVAEPARVGAALVEMRRSLTTKLNARGERATLLAVPGMTPNTEAVQQRLVGAQAARIAVFTHGRRVFQAVMLGAADDESAWEVFVASLRVGP